MTNPTFKVTLSSNPKPDAERESILEAPVFGANLTDHMVVCVWQKDQGWVSAEVVPYGPIMMDPSAAVLHYGQEIFEGIKAYRHPDGSIHTFRPHDNARRLQLSARRMACIPIVKPPQRMGLQQIDRRSFFPITTPWRSQ